MREEELSPELKQRIREYCQHKLGIGELPDEVREELHDHFQDRVLGYLNREDELSEDDAFLLAREHFGDPGAVRAQLGGEHATHSIAGLYRRMVASAIVFVVVQPVAWVVVSPFIDANDASMGNVAMARNALAVVCTVLSLGPLLYWRRQDTMGQKPWFTRWPPNPLVGVLLATYIGIAVVQVLAAPTEGPQPEGNPQVGVLGLIIYLMQAGIWFWWCRIPVRNSVVFLHSVLGVALYGWPLGIIQFLVTQDTSGSTLLGLVISFPAYLVQCLLLGLLYLGARWLVPLPAKG